MPDDERKQREKQITEDVQHAGAESDRLRLAYFTVVGILGCYLPYMNLYFQKDLHFTNARIGGIFAIRQFMLALSPPLWGTTADKIQRPRLLIFIAAIGAGIAIFLFSAFTVFGAFIILMAVFGFFYAALQPLLNSLTFGFLNTRKTSNYGRIRYFSFMGFTFATIALWGILSQPGTNVRWNFYLAAFFAGLTAIVAWLLPKTSTSTEGKTAKPAAKLFTSRDLLVFTIAGIIGRGTMMGYYSFFSNYLYTQNYPIPWMGLIWSIAAASAMPFIFFLQNGIDRFGIKLVYGVGLSAVAVRLFMISFSGIPALVYVSQLLHGLTFGAFFTGGLIYVNSRSPCEIRSTSQTLFYGLVKGVGGISGSLIAGALSDSIGYSGMLRAFSFVAAGGAILFFIFFKPVESQNEG